MSPSIYLDTARLGQMCPKAQAADRDFARLASEEGCSLYYERFLRFGYNILSRVCHRRFDGISDWSGVTSLEKSLKALVGLPLKGEVLLVRKPTSRPTDTEATTVDWSDAATTTTKRSTSGAPSGTLLLWAIQAKIMLLCVFAVIHQYIQHFGA